MVSALLKNSDCSGFICTKHSSLTVYMFAIPCSTFTCSIVAFLLQLLACFFFFFFFVVHTFLATILDVKCVCVCVCVCVCLVPLWLRPSSNRGNVVQSRSKKDRVGLQHYFFCGEGGSSSRRQCFQER